MDTDDAAGQYGQYLAAQKATLKAAMIRDGQLPTDRKRRGVLISNFHMIAMIQKMQNNVVNNIQWHSSFLPLPYPPSIASIDELKPIYIKELRLGIHHRGTYLLVRAVTGPNKMTAIMAIVEDETSDAVMMQLFQQPDEEIQPPSSIITQGDVFLVKEPFFKIMSDGEYGLRIDHISDIVPLDGYHKMCPKEWIQYPFNMNRTAEFWKRKGNAEMENKQHWDAIQSYTTALASNPSPSEKEIIQRNRALAYLQDESFESALADTQCLSPTPSMNEKALYRAGKALYNLGRFSECQSIFQKLCKNYPNHPEGAKELERARARLAEQKTGIYDFKTLYREVARVRPPHLDHATFVGPVEVRQTPDRGRGLFTTRAVKAGELLLCEKAFAHCYAASEEESFKGTSKISLLINPHTDRMTLGTQSELITTIVQKISRNPSLFEEFTDLFRGSYEKADVTEVDGKPVIDTFLVEKIISLNVFGCPLTSKKSHLNPTTIEKKFHSCGIWTKATMINHSCSGNCRRSFIGDLQIIHATTDIASNTELGFWYNIPNGDSASMKKGLENWGFKCNCAICLDSSNTSNIVLKKRKAFLEDLKKIFDARIIDTLKFERILGELDRTYGQLPTLVPRLELRPHYVRLVSVYAKKGNKKMVIGTVLKALECLGFVVKAPQARVPIVRGASFEVEKWGIMTDDVDLLFWYLGLAYKALGAERGLLEQVIDCARLAYRICVGEDVTFEEAFGKL